jgi:membrane fusion protein, copper/silver efflux system
MNRLAMTCLALGVVSMSGAGGYWIGRQDSSTENTTNGASSAAGASSSLDPVIYYVDPDGKPVYSATPKQTDDGRPFRPVHADEDVGFEDKSSVSADIQESAAPRRILYYRNPMGLADTSPKPKKDSMGMEYIPVYDDENDGPAVKISLGRLQRTGVRSEEVVRRAIVRVVRAPGTVQLDERRISVVATRSDSFVEEVASVTTGDRVTKGQSLFRIYSPEIAVAGAQFLTELRNSGPGAGSGGARQRLENLGVMPDAIAEIERTLKPPLSIAWKSPRDGVVLERNIASGMKVAAGDPLFRIADISTVWVVADIPEYDLAAVRVGATARIRFRHRGVDPVEGRISVIYPQIGEIARTGKVRIEIPNPSGFLLPNMYVDVEVGTGTPDPVVAVPDSAMIDSGNRQIVIIDKGDGRFEPRAVKIGMKGEGYAEIRDGIAVGEKVVVAANFLIDAESNLKAALRSLTSPEPRP